MKKFCYVNRSKYRKLGKPEISYILEKTLVLSTICSTCKNKNEKTFREEESIEIIKILDLINNVEDYYLYIYIYIYIYI